MTFGKRLLSFDLAEGLPMKLYGLEMCEEVLAIVGNGGKEIGCSECLGTVIVHIDGEANLPLGLTNGVVIEHLWVGFLTES